MIGESDSDHGEEAVFESLPEYREPLTVLPWDNYTRQFGRPTPTSQIGEGNFAVVYQSLNPDSVLKAAKNPQDNSLLLAEAIATARVNDLNSIEVALTPDYRLVIRAPKAKGAEFFYFISEHREQKALAYDAGTRMMGIILEYAHERGVAIRDLKWDGLLIRHEAIAGRPSLRASWVDLNAATIIPHPEQLDQVTASYEAYRLRLNQLAQLEPYELTQRAKRYQKLRRQFPTLFGAEDVNLTKLNNQELADLSLELRFLLRGNPNLKQKLGDKIKSLSYLPQDHYSILDRLFIWLTSQGQLSASQIKAQEWSQFREDLAPVWQEIVNVLEEDQWLIEQVGKLETIDGPTTVVSEILLKLGLTDKELSKLVGAEALLNTYLDPTVRGVLHRNLNDTVYQLRQVSRGRFKGIEENLIHHWFLDFQEEATADWETFLGLLEGVSNEHLTALRYDQYVSLLARRRQIIASAQKDMTPINSLHQELCDIDHLLSSVACFHDDDDFEIKGL